MSDPWFSDTASQRVEEEVEEERREEVLHETV